MTTRQKATSAPAVLPDAQPPPPPLDFIKVDGSGTQTPLSVLDNVDIDLTSEQCGSYGCTYRLKAPNDGWLVKLGRIKDMEYYRAKIMGRLGVGPSVGNELMPIQLFRFEKLLRDKNGDPEMGNAFFMEAFTGDLDNLVLDPKHLPALERLFEQCMLTGVVHGDLMASNAVYRMRNGRIEFRLIDFAFTSLLLYDEVKRGEDLDAAAIRPPYESLDKVEAVVRLQVALDWLIVIQKYDYGRPDKAFETSLLVRLYNNAVEGGATVVARDIAALRKKIWEMYKSTYDRLPKSKRSGYPSPKLGPTLVPPDNDD